MFPTACCPIIGRPFTRIAPLLRESSGQKPIEEGEGGEMWKEESYMEQESINIDRTTIFCKRKPLQN